VAIAGRGVQAVEIGGKIIAALATASSPMTLSHVAEAAAMQLAQAHAYLVSFRKIGLVEQDAATGRYQLGPFALKLGLARLRSFEPLKVANHEVRRLSEALGLTTAVSIWGTDGPTIVHVQEGARQVFVNLRPGAVFSVTGTATGKVFAAFMPERTVMPRVETELRDIGSTQRATSPLSARAFLDELAEVRRLGYAKAEGSPIPTVNGLSAPVFDRTGAMQLAVTVMGPTRAVSIAPQSQQIAALVAFTSDISARFGYDPSGGSHSAP
jgi:DNA-binding IclR family transcriptional regulator